MLNNKRGSVYVMSALMTALITVMVGFVLINTLQDRHMARHLIDSANAQCAAESGLNIVLGTILNKQKEDTYVLSELIGKGEIVGTGGECYSYEVDAVYNTDGTRLLLNATSANGSATRQAAVEVTVPPLPEWAGYVMSNAGRGVFISPITGNCTITGNIYSDYNSVNIDSVTPGSYPSIAEGCTINGDINCGWTYWAETYDALDRIDVNGTIFYKQYFYQVGPGTMTHTSKVKTDVQEKITFPEFNIGHYKELAEEARDKGCPDSYFEGDQWWEDKILKPENGIVYVDGEVYIGSKTGGAQSVADVTLYGGIVAKNIHMDSPSLPARSASFTQYPAYKCDVIISTVGGIDLRGCINITGAILYSKTLVLLQFRSRNASTTNAVTGSVFAIGNGRLTAQALYGATPVITHKVILPEGLINGTTGAPIENLEVLSWNR